MIFNKSTFYGYLSPKLSVIVIETVIKNVLRNINVIIVIANQVGLILIIA
jgi:hypothetical protein